VTKSRSTDELLEELFGFLRIPSISSGDGDAVDLQRGAEWVCDRVRDAGGSAEVLPTARNPLAVGRIRSGRPAAPRLLVYGHYDVQTVAPIDAWESDPFAPELRDGYVYARGASDDKGNFHALLAPLVDLARAGDLGCDVTVVSDGEEEIGGDSVVRWLEADDGAYDAAIIFDSGLVAPGWPALTTGVRGIITAALDVSTGRRDVHSGMYGGAALNAAHVLAELIERTRARDGRLAPALEAGAETPTAAEVASWSTLPAGAGELAAAGIAPLDGAAAAAFYERTLARPTFDVNAITCRDASQQRTIIPVQARAAISMRLAAGQDSEAVLAALDAHLRSCAPAGATVSTTLWGRSDGCAFDPDLPPLSIARGVLADVFEHDCAVVRSGGAIPLMPALARRGTPTILTGIALADDNVHAPNERMLLANYERGVEAARRLYRELSTLPR
jgi:acetylornithine deacetylase/succinyl-diaminopimelate desuccinylase-like protein